MNISIAIAIVLNISAFSSYKKPFAWAISMYSRRKDLKITLFFHSTVSKPNL